MVLIPFKKKWKLKGKVGHKNIKECLKNNMDWLQ